MKKQWIAMILALVMVFVLAGCGAAQQAPTETIPAAETAAPAETPAPTEEPAAAEEPAEEPVETRIMVLNGTTGFGLANLMSSAQEGTSAQEYAFSVETDASNVTAALINGSTDIAALPTNAAAVVYNKTQGEVQVLALNTRGVLYLVTDESEQIQSWEDLKGKTVYAPAQNPTFVFTYLCEKNGLTVGEDVMIDNTYAQPADLNAAVSGGQVTIAVLPEPMVTIAKSANEHLVSAMDLTEEWNKTDAEGELIQGCVAVRKAFADEHPQAVAMFLQEYEQSVLQLQEDPAGTAEKIQQTGIFAKAAVAAKAIPNCNICFITGEDMEPQLSGFLKAMFDLQPNSVGGAMPGEDFYYIGA